MLLAARFILNKAATNSQPTRDSIIIAVSDKHKKLGNESISEEYQHLGGGISLAVAWWMRSSVTARFKNLAVIFFGYHKIKTLLIIQKYF